MVYGQIEPSIHHHVLTSKSPEGKPINATLVRKGLPVALLATCKLINEEAAPFFQSDLEVLENEPLKLNVDIGGADTLVSFQSSLVAYFGVIPEVPQVEVPPPEQLPSGPPAGPLLVAGVRLGRNETPEREYWFHYENTQSFVHRAAKILDRTRLCLITDDRPFDVEIRLMDEIGTWPKCFFSFMSSTYRVCKKSRVSIVVQAKLIEIEDTSDFAAARHEAWRNWQRGAELLYQPHRPTVRFEDIG